MHQHYIILSSSYSRGERIALDYVDIKIEDKQKIKQLLDKIKNECGENVSVSSYCVKAEGESWESVIRADRFYEDVCLIENSEEFVQLIKKDRVLTGLDVAKYILSISPNCTHLRLQKLLYLCYADYLIETSGKRLFEDTIYAYKLGPVIKSVYEKYKGLYHIESDKTLPKYKGLMSARSRLLFSEYGVEKIQSISESLLKYKGIKTSLLIDMTHTSGSPWSYCDSNKQNQKITDENIMENHKIEMKYYEDRLLR